MKLKCYLEPSIMKVRTCERWHLYRLSACWVPIFRDPMCIYGHGGYVWLHCLGCLILYLGFPFDQIVLFHWERASFSCAEAGVMPLIKVAYFKALGNIWLHIVQFFSPTILIIFTIPLKMCNIFTLLKFYCFHKL